MPFLTFIQGDAGRPDSRFPMNLPFMQGGLQLTLNSDITFFVGENGSGKSTLLEAIGWKCEFNIQGGGVNHSWDFREDSENKPVLADALRLAWTPRKIREGFYMRAESFFNFASYIDDIAREDRSILNAYGGRSLHQQSHGESFLSLFNNRFEQGIYILDEPEAALSPQRQLSFMTILRNLTANHHAQFLIATHSPILLCYPDAEIYSLDGGIEKIHYTDTEHYRLTRDFLNDPARYMRYLFE